ncbi:MAG: tetratricopeptide repeat protein [Caulobacteraceae bacterium]
MLAIILTYLPSLLCGVHVVRTGREMFWLWLFIIGPVIAPAFYFFAVLMPEWMGGSRARGVGKAARQVLDPERDYRNAMRALEDTPTVGNRMKLAQTAAALGRWDDAEAQWALCAEGHWADDPAILMGHAISLIELGRYAEALGRLEKLKSLGPEGRAPVAALAFARAYQGLGRNEEADDAYRFAADRVPGLESGARYVAFMAKAGRREDAEIGFAEIERRLHKIAPPLRAEARQWRDLAAKALGRG